VYSLVSFTNRADCHNITEMLLKMALYTYNYIETFLPEKNNIYFICDCHYISEILLKVALNTITLTISVTLICARLISGS
jgi:hypothetical protein